VLAPLLLAAAATLPPVIPDPRGGASPWVLVPARGEEPPRGAEGYLLELPAAGAVDQTWLERAVDLASRRVPVLSLGAEPPAEVRPYLDGAVLVPPPAVSNLSDLTARLGVPVVVPAEDPASAVEALAEGAAAVLVASPPPTWTAALADLLPETRPASLDDHHLATALRGGDLATVIGLPRGFAGGDVRLADAWYARAWLMAARREPLPLHAHGAGSEVRVPPLPIGGVVVVERPQSARVDVEEVRGERLPFVGEVLARHQRQAARQEREVQSWTATQRLLLRAVVPQLGRSFELVLQGPAFYRRGVGTDWEVTQAWLDGVAWDPDKLPELPLIQPDRPPVPPLALRLVPVYAYALKGVQERQGRRCFVLSFTGGAPGKRSGTAWLDASTYGLVELDERATELPGDVRATTSTTLNVPVKFGGDVVWVPETVIADDLVTAFGGGTSIHRRLTVTGLEIDPEDFARRRAEAYAGPHRMLRDTPGGVVRLVPDGRGGRVVASGRPARQRFLLAGVLSDPGLDFPIPYGGYQLLDFDFRGRGEQLRLFLAGLVNDAAWSRPGRRVELSAHGFTQLLPLTSSFYVRGREVKSEEVKLQQQRFGGGVARSLGLVRFSLDATVERLDFGRTSDTAASYVVPPDTWEGVAKAGVETTLRGLTLTGDVERGWRARWLEGGEQAWLRYHLSAVHESAPLPLAKLRLGAEYYSGRDLDRFSALSPGRLGGLTLRGIASNRVAAERLEVVRASFAVSLGTTLRGEVGADLAWARDRRSGYRNRPLAGVGVGFTLPGPWRTLMQGTLGYPVTTPGGRALTAEVLLLRPLGH
jgi:hypothetical protein